MVRNEPLRGMTMPGAIIAAAIVVALGMVGAAYLIGGDRFTAHPVGNVLYVVNGWSGQTDRCDITGCTRLERY